MHFSARKPFKNSCTVWNFCDLKKKLHELYIFSLFNKENFGSVSS